MLSWKVYVEDFNHDQIKTYDILDNTYFRQEARLIASRVGNDKQQFAEKIRRELMYWYWSKCEWEIILSSWPPRINGSFQNKKIDVFDQVEMNWEAFIDYLWTHKKEL